MTTDTLELPELPYTTLQLMDPEGELPFGEGYTEDDMRAYATAAVLAERERCAKVCEELSDAEENVISLFLRGKFQGALDCASAIRNKE